MCRFLGVLLGLVMTAASAAAQSPTADPALIEDLDQRGLLDTTLVIALGEFGRTPELNVYAGRDHWPNCFSLVLAGAGIDGGRVWGASDKDAFWRPPKNQQHSTCVGQIGRSKWPKRAVKQPPR